MKSKFLLRCGLAATVGIFVLGLCLFLIYDSIKGQMQWRQERAVRTFEKIAKSIAFFEKKNGRLPHSLSELKGLPDGFIMPVSEGLIRDSWGTPILYQSHDDKYVLISFGEDGKAGGVGLDCDLTSNQPKPPQAESSLIQVLSHESARGMFLASLVCAFVTALLALGAIAGHTLTREDIPAVVVKLVITLFGTAFVSWCVTLLHYPSGH